ncbi:MAG TPA: hypothetical protein VEK77_14360 [Gemmatimonadales bacterium]|nr:hypothetical protein [Gemmatimonadales bacterium]
MLGRCLLISTVLPVALAAQGTVQIEFVAPRDSMVATFGAANVQGGYAPGYRGIIIGAGNVARFRAIAPPLLVRTFDSLQPGSGMRRVIDTLLAVVGHGRVDIRYLLVNDSIGFAPGATGIFVARRQAGGPVSFIWPFATVDSGPGNRFSGIVRLGVHEIPTFMADAGGWKAWEEVVVHESHHTQWVGFPTKWRSIGISYGADGGHYASELLGDQPVPLDEGIATFYGEMLNEPSGYNGMIRFARDSSNRQYTLESWSVLAGSIPNNIPRVVIDTVAPFPPPGGGRYAFWGFRGRDVPGFYILFNENTGTLFHQFFWRNACTTRDAALRLILREDAAMWDTQLHRYLAFAANELARQMEAMAAAPAGSDAQACGVMTSSMFPYAILDILTHFGMSDQELRDEIGRQGVRASRASGEYLNQRAALRARIRPRMDANPVQIEQAITEAVQWLRDPARILMPLP